MGDHTATAQQTDAPAEPSTAELAHDINNLLGVVVTNLDLLVEQLDSNSRAAGLADEIVEAALRASGLSRRLMGAESSGQPKVGEAVTIGPRMEGRPAVLVVDDNAGLRRAVAEQLHELGYRAIEAGDGPAALLILNGEPVDLLFTDVVMPGGMSGFDLARLVLARWPAMKAVITSAFPELEPIGDSITAGKLRRLTKPYRKGELARTLHEVLATNLPPA